MGWLPKIHILATTPRPKFNTVRALWEHRRDCGSRAKQPMQNVHLLVERTDVSRMRRSSALPIGPLPPSSVLLRVDKYAVTANNVTYATIGDLYQYFDFFSKDFKSQGLGSVPVW